MLLGWKTALTSCALLSLAACAPAEDAAVSAESAADSELQVYAAGVDPKAKVGTFDLDRIYGDASYITGAFRLSGIAIDPGTRRDVPIGNLSLISGSGTAFADGMLPIQSRTVTIKEGVTTYQSITALRVRYDRPVTIGSSTLRVSPRSGSSGSFTAKAEWTRRSSGAGMMMFPGDVTLSGDALPSRTLTLSDGLVTDVVLPTVQIRPWLDSYDPQFPDYPSCDPIRFLAGASRESRNVRNRDGSPFESVVAPAGPSAPLVLRVYGAEIPYPTTGESTIWLELTRVEINDLEVPGTSGTVRAPGTYRIERQNAAGTYAFLSCTPRTKTGVDLPPGKYRITTTARSPNGMTYTGVDEFTLL